MLRSLRLVGNGLYIDLSLERWTATRKVCLDPPSDSEQGSMLAAAKARVVG
jgi:hypothetical protein